MSQPNPTSDVMLDALLVEFMKGNAHLTIEQPLLKTIRCYGGKLSVHGWTSITDFPATREGLIAALQFAGLDFTAREDAG